MSIFAPLWSYGIYIIAFVFVLSTVVFFHELGHFLIGRWCGVKVDAFSLGFGPELTHFMDRYGTRWRLAAFPLGGYVKFHGDANGASVTDENAAANMPPEERAVSFFAQKVWKRAAIVAAGPGASFLLAIVLFTGIFYVEGHGVLAPRVNGVVAGSAAEGAGFKAGDLIVSIDGRKIGGFEEMQRIVQASGDETLQFVVERDGQMVDLVATPRRRDVVTAFGTTRIGVLGVEAPNDPANWHVEHYSLLGSARLAVTETWYVVYRTGSYIGGLFVGRESAQQLSGLGTIAQASGEMAKIGFSALLSFTAILSISIGFLNLMPIPLLDGGHLFFYAVEAIRGRALNEKTQQFGYRVGLTLVAGLMLFANYNDIARWMHWS